MVLCGLGRFAGAQVACLNQLLTSLLVCAVVDSALSVKIAKRKFLKVDRSGTETQRSGCSPCLCLSADCLLKEVLMMVD